MPSISILDHFQRGGIIIGDGSYIFTLERRGFVKAGPYTPEVVVRHPEAVRQLSREFARAGAHVIQALTYAANPSKLASHALAAGVSYENLNNDAIKIAQEVAKEVDAYVCGSVSPTVSFKNGLDETAVKAEIQMQIGIFVQKNVNFLLGEFFGNIQEAVWAVEVMRSAGDGEIPVAMTMRIGPTGDFNDVPLQECAVRLVNAGADIIGVNCGFDPDISLKSIAIMRQGLHDAGLSAFLMTQPCGFHCQEAENTKRGFYNLPEYPYALEPRTLTRLDCYKYARKAYELGVNYIGGCCGFEPHHIRGVALELEKEIGKPIPGREHVDKWAESMSIGNSGRMNFGEAYWKSIIPAVGRKEIQIFATPNPEERLCKGIKKNSKNLTASPRYG